MYVCMCKGVVCRYRACVCVCVCVNVRVSNVVSWLKKVAHHSSSNIALFPCFFVWFNCCHMDHMSLSALPSSVTSSTSTHASVNVNPDAWGVKYFSMYRKMRCTSSLLTSMFSNSANGMSPG